MTNDHIAAGDRMQSELSRIIAWCKPGSKAFPIGDTIPYEVRMAIFGGESAVAAWAEARKRDAARDRVDRWVEGGR